MIGTYLIKLYMNGGKNYEIKSKAGIEEFFDLEIKDGFLQIDENTWINPDQISSIEVEFKLW